MPNRLLVTKLNTPSAEQNALPYFPLLPKDAIGLLKWRLYVRERCLTDLEFRQVVNQCCAADVAFFAATFAFFHETRAMEGTKLGRFPVVFDADQIDILAWFAKYGGTVDITVSKTRGIGLSFLACVYLLWIWLYHGEQTEIACVTKDESSLDLRDRPSSLLGKLDLLFDALPAWLRVDTNGNQILDRTVTKHKFQNLSNGNVIGGFVATDEKLRSGRYYIVVLDEAAFFPSDIQRWFSAASGTSPSILWLSTFNGTSNLFYRICANTNPNLNVVRIETFWQNNHRFAKGMYVSKNGQIEILDKEYVFPIDYPFSHDDPGLERSPLIDAAFNRPGANKQSILEELYGVAVADSRKLIGKQVVTKVEKTIRNCVWRGDYSHGEWVADEAGPLKLWAAPDSLTGVYAIGCDPSLGSLTGAAAGLAAIDVKTGAIMLTAKYQDLDGIAFAQKAVEVAKALAGPRGAGCAKLAWESTGIGIAFSGEVARLRYPAIWMENGKSAPGYHNMDRGEAILLEFGRALLSGDGIIYCRDLLTELTNFEYDSKFDLIYAGVEGHGDLAIAAALAWRAGAQRRKAIIEQQTNSKKTNEIELNEYAQKQRKQSYSDQFETRKRA